MFYGPLTLQILQTINDNQKRKKEEKLAQLQAHHEAKEREVKEKSKRMTLYKGTLVEEDLANDELQVEPTRIPLTLKITNDTTFELDALLDPSTSHNFISFEAWQTLPKGSMVQTNAIVRAINGT